MQLVQLVVEPLSPGRGIRDAPRRCVGRAHATPALNKFLLASTTFLCWWAVSIVVGILRK